MNTTYSICRLERPRKAPSAIKLTRLFPTSSLSSTPRFANPDSSSLDRWLEDRLLWKKQEGNNKYISAKRWLQTGSAVVMLHVSYFKKTNKTELPFFLLFIFPDQPYLQSVCRDQILHQKRICESLRIYFFSPQSKLWWEQIKIAEHVHNPQATCLLSGLCDKSEKKWGKRGRKKRKKQAIREKKLQTWRTLKQQPQQRKFNPLAGTCVDGLRNQFCGYFKETKMQLIMEFPKKTNN